jgi:hypothetical protein
MDGYGELMSLPNESNQSTVNLHDHIPTILAVGFLSIYALVQIYCVMHSTSANDIISARLQDVVIMIVSYYFGSSHREKPTQP